MKEDFTNKTCPLCGRMLTKKSSSKHHLIPKTFKGKETVTLHKICHSKIHTTFSERELAKEYKTIESILGHEEIQKFVKWVKKKDPNFYVKNKDSKERKKKRRK